MWQLRKYIAHTHCGFWDTCFYTEDIGSKGPLLLSDFNLH
jgi:hypothetical protein